jgi:aminoglycoside phosphotransferase (APT) family kinase protein
VRVARLAQLAGGASREAWLVDLRVGDDPPLGLVMRRDMGGSLTTSALDRATEFAVLGAALDAGVPVPRPFFEPVVIAGKDAFFMERVEGESVGRRIVGDPAFAAVRARLPPQLAAALAAIHRIDPAAPAIAGRLPAPPAGKSATAVDVERLYRELDSLNEPHPALEIALRRLVLDEPPPQSETTFVHGDFRMGNVVVGDEGLRAVLDWEFAHAGDPYEDIAWICVRAWRFGNDALEAGGIAGREAWLSAYEAASGRTIDRDRVAYHELLGNVKWAVGALMQARRHLNGEERSIELASLGRIAAEMEDEALALAGAREGVRR